MIKLSHPHIGEREIEAVAEVLRSGKLVQGEKVQEFESALSSYMDVPYVVAVTSGTSALHLAMLALGIGPGDAVIVPAFTFPATVNVVEIVGARPVLVDVDRETYCIDVQELRKTLESWSDPEKPKAVIPVHEFGAPCAMEEIVSIAKEYGLYVIEDAACALGTRIQGKHAGTFGDLGCFSFHPRKAITTGEGGAIVTARRDLYEKLLQLRNHGIHKTAEGTIDFYLPGFNYRMTEFQAVLGTLQLQSFEQILQIRQSLVCIYQEILADAAKLKLPSPVEGHAWQSYMVILPTEVHRQTVIKELLVRNIETNLGAQAIHMLHYYQQKYKYVRQDYPVAAELYEHGLVLPLHVQLTTEDVVYTAIMLSQVIHLLKK